MTGLFTSLLTGAALGLSGGLAPGPLTALVVRESLSHGTRAGMRVALAPVLTDGPLLLGAAFLAAEASSLDPLFGVISAIGSVFLMFLAWESTRATSIDLSRADGAPSGSLIRAIGTNLLNPHPYLFWVAIGGPLVADAWAEGPGPAIGFLVGFFGCLCGAKAGMAWAVGANRARIGGPVYVWTMRFLGIVMLGFSLHFAHNAYDLLSGS